MPEYTFIAFQMTFACITPALIVGAFAERIRFSAVLLFTALWVTFIYFPMAHMVWWWGGPDFLAEQQTALLIAEAAGDTAAAEAAAANLAANGLLWNWGALDFAGGTVVHINAGIAGLVGCIMLGKRIGYGKESMAPHSLTMTMIGGALLWVGWFGFNAGSALAASRLASSAFAATHFAAASGGLTWAVLEWWKRGRPSVLGVCSGLVAGLACITQAAGYVTPMPALLIGVLGAATCYLACTVVKARFRYDDSLDVFGVHGVAGTLGALLTGIFATRATGACGDGKLLGVLEGGSLLKAQVFAIVVAWGLAVLGTFAILKVVDACLGLRVSREGEVEGLDLNQHDEEGYILN
jgi:Amt family ammonium transporter